MYVNQEYLSHTIVIDTPVLDEDSEYLEALLSYMRDYPGRGWIGSKESRFKSVMDLYLFEVVVGLRPRWVSRQRIQAWIATGV